MVPAEVQAFMGRVVTEIINPIIGVLFALALFYFLFGLSVFILNAGDATKRTEAKSHMVWGLVGLAVMLSAYGLINMGRATIGI